MKRRIIFSFLIGFLFITVFADNPNSITVDDPHSGNSWCKALSYTIKWTKSGTLHAKVKIRLYDTTGTVKILNIKNDTDNDGSYKWFIPLSVTSGNYRVRVKTLDNAVYDDSDIFQIKVCSTGSITVTKPGAGDTWCKEKSYPILWEKSGTLIPKVKVLVKRTSKPDWTYIAQWGAPNSGSFNLKVPKFMQAGVDYFVRIETLDDAVTGNSGIFKISSCYILGIWSDKLKKIGLFWWVKNAISSEGGSLYIGSLSEKFSNPGKEPVFIHVFFKGKSIAKLGMFGKNQRLPQKVEVKFSRLAQNAIKMGGKGFELKILNMKDQVLHSQPLVIKNRRLLKKINK